MTSRYYDSVGKEVFTGNIARAEDLNRVNTSVDAGFVTLEGEIDLIDIHVTEKDALLDAAIQVRYSLSSQLIAVDVNKTFTLTESGRYIVGQAVLVTDTANKNNWMHGYVVSYTHPSLVVHVLETSGTGTYASWNITCMSHLISTFESLGIMRDDLIAEGDTQVARVVTEGDTQDARVVSEGDTQDARVVTEGDTQVARVIAEGDAQISTMMGLEEAAGLSADAAAASAAEAAADVLETAADVAFINTIGFGTTGSIPLPAGTTAQRPVTPLDGHIRYNEDTESFEGYVNGAWAAVGQGATGASQNPVFYENDTNVTGDYTITSGKNAMSAGPITIDAGVSVTVPSGSVWTVV